MNTIGFIHSIETGAMVDGPGIRYAVFLQGCPLRCKYCHNPDTWERGIKEEMTVAELVTDIKKYRSFMKFSGGGVTITGGEPLAQPEFLLELLEELEKNKLHVALDTSGFASETVVSEILPLVDLLILDIKSIDPEEYQNAVGVPIEPMLRTLKMAKELGITTWVRYVMVPGLTDNFDNIKALALYLRDYDNIKKIEVLPFHKMGEYKWAELGLTYELKNTREPNVEDVDRAKSILGIG